MMNEKRYGTVAALAGGAGILLSAAGNSTELCSIARPVWHDATLGEYRHPDFLGDFSNRSLFRRVVCSSTHSNEAESVEQVAAA
jgi:hypothetical protein